MKNFLKFTGIVVAISLSLIILIPACSQAQLKQISLKVNIKDVNRSRVTVIALSNPRDPIGVEMIFENENAEFIIDDSLLPGEFLLGFDYYKDENTQRPSKSEKIIVINDYSTHITVNPMKVNDLDYTFFSKNDQENIVFSRFMQTNSKQLEMLELLQDFLANYDDKETDFYKMGIAEFEKRRLEHNAWLEKMYEDNENLFAASLFKFFFVPEVRWEGSEFDRKQSVIENYFSGINFNDTMILKSSNLKTWMDQYVNNYVELYADYELDSIFTLAGYNAIEAAKNGHPLVYGWMVDYFFNGYESMGIEKGIVMLSDYLADPNCKTQKRKEIERRIRGIQTIVPGTDAKDILFSDKNANSVSMLNYKTEAKYKLLVFWSAECPHCVQTLSQIHSWHKENSKVLEVFAVSLDDTADELKKYQEIKKQLTGFHHILTKGGINSPEASSYFVLATPVLFLIDAETNKIIALPNTLNEVLEKIK